MADDAFDPTWNLVRGKVTNIGYHTALPEGTPVHPTRESMDYALTCLGAGNHERAAAVIDTVLALQDRDPYSPTYGIWSWYAEEGLAHMSPPDWNWADFIGVRLLDILRYHGEAVGNERIDRIRVAIGHAAWSIFRRNVRPDYTNIAIMGAVVCGAAGAVLGQPLLTDYARRRLAAVAAAAAEVGGLAEYNSPTYTVVAIEELDRLLGLVDDVDLRAEADALRCTLWGWVADRWHPATSQWGGPHARAYSDCLGARTLRFLQSRTGLPLGSTTIETIPAEGVPAPDAVRARFQALPQASNEVRQRVARTPHGDRVLTTWMDAQVCLGSVSHDTSWIQRRPILAYGLTHPGGETAVLKVQFLKDGRDFASGMLFTQQSGPRVVVAATLVRGQGDHHCHLDKPADGRFAFADLRWRWCLLATDARAELSNGIATLQAGALVARIVCGPAHWGTRLLQWSVGQDAAGAYCEVTLSDEPGVCDVEAGPALQVACGLALEAAGQLPPLTTSTIGDGDSATFQVAWGALSVSAPLQTPVI